MKNIQLLKFFLQSPAYQLIFTVAQRNRSLLLVMVITNLFSVALEGATLGIAYMAITFLSNIQSDHKRLIQILSLLENTNLSQYQIFFILLMLAVILQILLSLSLYINKVATNYFAARTQTQATRAVFQQIMSFSFGCASRYKVGDLIKFVGSASGTVNNQILTLSDLIISSTFVIAYVLILMSMSPFLALAAFLLSGIVTLVQRSIIPKVALIARQVMHNQVETSKYITENIQAIRLLHTFGTQNRALAKVDSLLNENQQKLQERSRIIFLPETILGVLPIIAVTILATISYTVAPSPEAILPTLLTFLLGLQRLILRLKGVATCITKLADAEAGIHRLNEILTHDDKQFYPKTGEAFDAIEQDIQFENVCLAYDKNQSFVLDQLSFSIPKNKITALVGQSGAGKSSIVDLLIGLYQPTFGQITVNRKSLNSYIPDTWQQRIGVVSQDTFIFNDSILENLRYGNLRATFEEVVAAAKVAHAHSFILDLPDGYDTTVGERGYRLSGGQRQRLAMARAILKQPEMLIFDEATSALDSESELLIQQALLDFQRNRTIVIVAHRLSTIVEADQILVLEKGQIIESGNHYSLLRQAGRYAHYWNLQTQKVLV
jgi:ATP-binding cassette, subfamily B, bacterial MsbA